MTHLTLEAKDEVLSAARPPVGPPPERPAAFDIALFWQVVDGAQPPTRPAEPKPR